MAVQGEQKGFTELQAQLLEYYGVRATSDFVELESPHMVAHVLTAGSGEPAVIVHGCDGEAVDWAPLMGVLQDHLQLYAVDRPGFGLTDRFDYRGVPFRPHAGGFMRSLLKALRLETVTLIGGSFGGFFCLVTALDHPGLVQRLVLVGAPVGVSRAASLPLRLLCGVPGAARLLMKRTATLEGQRSQYQHEFHIDPDTVPELYFRMRTAGVRRPGAQETFARVLRRVGGLRGIRPEVYVGDELPAITVPTLFVWGEHDDLIPLEDGRAASERMLDSRFVVLEDVGHFPFLEAPQETGRLIVEFMERTAVGGRA
jgi:pimeloyl-ACP methyl ester carboxylesterase